MTSNPATDHPRPPVLPLLRSFKVVSQNYDEKVETIVHAHEVSFTPHGALCFVTYVIEDGAFFERMPRVFNVHSWDDYEEILRVESLLVH